MTTDFSVIILAAGSGTRLGTPVPKQFVDVGGRRLVDFSLDAFVGWASQVIVTIPADAAGDDVTLPAGVEAVRGGDTRAESVRRALALVEHDAVLIHDAARPFVTREIASAVLDALADATCAYPVMPVPSTIVTDAEGSLSATPGRESLREVQTPQGFRTAALREVLDAGPRDGANEPHSHLP